MVHDVDLQRVGVIILTLGLYLRPSADTCRWTGGGRPEEFDRRADARRALGFAHPEAFPLTRSSYHARLVAVAADQG